MKRILILFCVASLVLVGVTNAAVKQGDTELDLLGGWIGVNGTTDGIGDITQWFVMGRIGYFVTNEIQVSAGVMGAFLDNDFSAKLYGIGVQGKYHFMTDNNWVPYVGAQFNWVTLDNDDSIDGYMWGPVAGLRYELNEHNDFFVEYQYQMYENDIGDVIENANMVVVGIVHQFK